MFPIVVTIFASILAPKGAPLIGTVMLGNLMKECGVVDRLKRASENEIANIVTLLLGLCIGATMEADKFLRGETLLIFALGFIAISLDTAVGVLFGKLMCALTGGKINPLIGAAGISAFPMSARVVQAEGQKYNKKNYLLMHAMSANAGGQIGSVIAAAVMLSVLARHGHRRPIRANPMAQTREDLEKRLASLEQVALDADPKVSAKQRAEGKLTARERIDKLLDPGTFVEEFMLAETQCSDFGMAEKKLPSDGVVTGFGKIDGRPVYVYSQDRAVLAGSVGSAHAEKIAYVIQTRAQARRAGHRT